MDKATTKSVSLLITYQCNLNCTYCYEKRKSNKTMAVADAKRYILEEVDVFRSQPKYENLEISFMGGEPLMEFEKIKAIAEWCWEQEWDFPYILFATTNGTLLDDERKQWFFENKDRIVLGLSFDGDETMQNINRSNSADSVDLDFFVRTWPKQGVKLTISPQSLPYLSSGIISLHNKRVTEINANLAFGIEWTDDSIKEYSRQLSLLVEYYTNHPEVPRCSLLNIDLISALTFTAKQSKYCGCGVGTITIDTDGQRYPCQMFAPITVDKNISKEVLQKNFAEVNNFVVEECRKCVLNKICPKCYGMNFLMSGDMKTQPQYLCKTFKLQYLYNCELISNLLERGAIKKYPEEYHRVIDITKKIFTNLQNIIIYENE